MRCVFGRVFYLACNGIHHLKRRLARKLHSIGHEFHTVTRMICSFVDVTGKIALEKLRKVFNALPDP